MSCQRRSRNPRPSRARVFTPLAHDEIVSHIRELSTPKNHHYSLQHHTDLVLSGPRVYRISIDRAAAAARPAPPRSAEQSHGVGSLQGAGRRAARRRGATVEAVAARRDRRGCGGGPALGGASRAVVKFAAAARRERAGAASSIFTRSGAGRTADTPAHAKAVSVDAVARKTPRRGHAAPTHHAHRADVASVAWGSQAT